MSKRPPKRDDRPIHEKLEEIGAQQVAASPNPTPYRRSAQSLPLSLDDIRAQALRERANIVHTIADLEAWRAEIDATIAFLRSPQG
jgi:hypothetical protein